MKANELRIGSLVYITDTSTLLFYKQVTQINIHNLMYLCGETKDPFEFEIEPIPLTEEWLLKFGFRKVSVCEYELSIKLEKFEDWWDYYKEEETSIYVILEDGIMVEVNKVGVKSKDEDLEVMSFKLPHIQNVHQLQNLFQSLTNEELI